ncbi:MAG: PIN domain-containing protein [Deltaproteobacteria bacterium]|nr:PIN domain-containing protein [Deltaproteobacteria bacterium]
MTPHFGIDTSILVRLLTGDPPKAFERCVRVLMRLIEQEEAEIVASNQVIGEAYVALQHHYGVSKGDARLALETVLRSGMVAPLNGAEVFAALRTQGGCGLVDRLIADDYQRRDVETLTVDARMARLLHARRL